MAITSHEFHGLVKSKGQKQMTQWGPTGSKMGKDPKKKTIPRPFSKKRTTQNPKPYMKIMSRRGA